MKRMEVKAYHDSYYYTWQCRECGKFNDVWIYGEEHVMYDNCIWCETPAVITPVRENND